MLPKSRFVLREGLLCVSLSKVHCCVLTGNATRVCCSDSQMVNLAGNLNLPEQLGFGRCPSCIHNFRKLFCTLTCSPHQSKFVEVLSTKPADQDKLAVAAINYYLSYNNTGWLSTEAASIQKEQQQATIECEGAPPASARHKQALYIEEVSCLERLGSAMEVWIETAFRSWGTWVAGRPVLVMSISLQASVLLSLGLLFNYDVTIDPVKLWASPASQARRDMEYFNQHFGPFYRIEQLIITPSNQSYFTKDIKGRNVTWGPAFEKDFLLEVLDLQNKVENLLVEHDNQTVKLENICLAPLSPVNKHCAIQSVFGYFQDNRDTLLDRKDEYLDHIYRCFKGKAIQECFSRYGGPLESTDAILGGFNHSDYATAQALVITIPVINYNEKEKIQPALAWETECTDLLLTSGGDLCLSQVDSKVTLGLVGVIIVLLSVTSALGLFFILGVSATLIIIEVIPFLVLAVGVDNIFILVQAFQRDKPRAGEPLANQIGRVVGDIAPSMMLSSFSMASAFFIGTLTDMPAVRQFALFAAVALVFNFILQMTCFLGLFTLDARRQMSNRLDVCCWIRGDKKPKPGEELQGGGILVSWFQNVWGPLLMWTPARVAVLIGFVGWLCASLAVAPHIPIGLDQELSVPEDSYMTTYFQYLNKYLSVGPPLYFIIKDGYNYTDPAMQNRICGLLNCNQDSLAVHLQWMADRKNM
ncbi:NPC1 [Cordylochernes scorpioides]|uniref:NPC1 n=1 Tax=Cordylochernes scorpioides TaxID=51811 RepID=A0ABY6JV11_9ARAC|nr:NPC1 [Cordylochernes scorpioides]